MTGATPPRAWKMPYAPTTYDQQIPLPAPSSTRCPRRLPSSSSLYVNASKPGFIKRIWFSARAVTSVFMAAIFVCTLAFLSVSTLNHSQHRFTSSPSHSSVFNGFRPVSRPPTHAQYNSSTAKQITQTTSPTTITTTTSSYNDQVANHQPIAIAANSIPFTESSSTSPQPVIPHVQPPPPHHHHHSHQQQQQQQQPQQQQHSAEKHQGQATEIRDNPDPSDLSTFTLRTCLNYFHLHKTGGVSFKQRLYVFFRHPERIKQTTNSRVKILDTCHKGTNGTTLALGKESVWSCDGGQLSSMEASARNEIDIVMGHQYWEKGAETLIPNRDVRFFTVLRHPLHRKVSFYYHFFVRNSGRKEVDVSENELKDFILARKWPDSSLVRDAGPAYYASRLWSDGWSGFSEDNQFDIAAAALSKTEWMSEESLNVSSSLKDLAVKKSIKRLRRKFVFIGLQSQEAASLCMLEKTVRALSKVHGISNMEHVEEISKITERMNAGSYGLDGTKLWNGMSELERREYRHVEQVDLEIYKEGVRMFNEMASRFGCDHLVEVINDDELAPL